MYKGDGILLRRCLEICLSFVCRDQRAKWRKVFGSFMPKAEGFLSLCIFQDDGGHIRALYIEARDSCQNLHYDLL